MIKIRKVSTYTGLGLTKWLPFEKMKGATEFIVANQSVTGAFYWISKGVEEKTN